MWRIHMETGPSVTEAIAGHLRAVLIRIPNIKHKQRCVCVLLCFIKPILGNHYSPGVIP